MSRVTFTVALLALVLATAGCQRQSGGGPAVSEYAAERQSAIERQRARGGDRSRERRRGAGDEAGSAEAISTGVSTYAYDPIGKRDPFRAFILERPAEGEALQGPLEQFDLSQLRVTGVVWETNRPRALVVDPSGRHYIVREGDAIGKNNGRVVAINESNVRVRETYVDFHGERTTKDIDMRVRQSQGG